MESGTPNDGPRNLCIITGNKTKPKGIVVKPNQVLDWASHHIN